MPVHEAHFQFVTPHAERIYQAIAPELSDEVNPRSTTHCRRIGTDMLEITIMAQDIAALRAALNMYLRLVNVADEMQQIG